MENTQQIRHRENDLSELEKSKLEVLLRDYDLTNQKIEQFIRAQPTHFMSGSVIFFGLLGLFTKTNAAKTEAAKLSEAADAVQAASQSYLSTEILYLLPLIMMAYFGVILYHYQRNMALQAYKKRLEDEINSMFQEKLMFYGELGIIRMENKNWFMHFNFGAFALMFVLSVIVAFGAGGNPPLKDFFMESSGWLIGTLSVATFVIFIIALIKLRHEYNGMLVDSIYMKSKKWVDDPNDKYVNGKFE